jgi:pimeloyl-ACP methyl ester carboxylesterase
MGMANPGLIHALAAVPASPPPVRDAASLRRVEAPVLIASHEGDPIHEASTARRLGSILPNATVEIAPQPLAMLDDMTDFSRRLASFLSSPAPVAG